MKNILLTGSGGFIGSYLKKWLEEYNLFCPRSFELNLMDKDAVQDYVEKNNIDFIIHSASCGVRISEEATSDEVARPNIEMFLNLANLNLPMITFGSGAEYDKSKALVNVKENDFGKSIPRDPYGYSKYMISKEIEKRNNILNLRIFGIYGYGEHSSRVTSSIINDNLNHKPIELNQNVKFHFIYIDDFCKIVKYFIENPTTEKFINVTPNDSIEIIELAKIINKISDYKSEIIIKSNGMNKEYTANNELLLTILKDFLFTSYEEGMSKLYNLLKTKEE